MQRHGLAALPHHTPLPFPLALRPASHRGVVPAAPHVAPDPTSAWPAAPAWEGRAGRAGFSAAGVTLRRARSTPTLPRPLPPSPTWQTPLAKKLPTRARARGATQAVAGAAASHGTAVPRAASGRVTARRPLGPGEAEAGQGAPPASASHRAPKAGPQASRAAAAGAYAGKGSSPTGESGRKAGNDRTASRVQVPLGPGRA